jgi:hypothetical protein
MIPSLNLMHQLDSKVQIMLPPKIFYIITKKKNKKQKKKGISNQFYDYGERLSPIPCIKSKYLIRMRNFSMYFKNVYM